jgi:hypothetical protein
MRPGSPLRPFGPLRLLCPLCPVSPYKLIQTHQLACLKLFFCATMLYMKQLNHKQHSTAYPLRAISERDLHPKSSLESLCLSVVTLSTVVVVRLAHI